MSESSVKDYQELVARVGKATASATIPPESGLSVSRSKRLATQA